MFMNEPWHECGLLVLSETLFRCERGRTMAIEYQKYVFHSRNCGFGFGFIYSKGFIIGLRAGLWAGLWVGWLVRLWFRLEFTISTIKKEIIPIFISFWTPFICLWSAVLFWAIYTCFESFCVFFGNISTLGCILWDFFLGVFLFCDLAFKNA